MSRGKYSPFCPPSSPEEYIYNCYGQVPSAWNEEVKAAGTPYDQKMMLADYDSDGFDQYGYSCFSKEGVYKGLGEGVDRLGYTESDYSFMEDAKFDEMIGMRPDPLSVKLTKIINSKSAPQPTLTGEQIFELYKNSNVPYKQPYFEKNRFTDVEEMLYRDSQIFSPQKFARLVEQAIRNEDAKKIVPIQISDLLSLKELIDNRTVPQEATNTIFGGPEVRKRMLNEATAQIQRRESSRN